MTHRPNNNYCSTDFIFDHYRKFSWLHEAWNMNQDSLSSASSEYSGEAITFAARLSPPQGTYWGQRNFYRYVSWKDLVIIFRAEVTSGHKPHIHKVPFTVGVIMPKNGTRQSAIRWTVNQPNFVIKIECSKNITLFCTFYPPLPYHTCYLRQCSVLVVIFQLDLSCSCEPGWGEHKFFDIATVSLPVTVGN